MRLLVKMLMILIWRNLLRLYKINKNSELCHIQARTASTVNEACPGNFCIKQSEQKLSEGDP